VFEDLNFVHDHKMKAIMTIENLTTIEALENCTQGNQAVAFAVLDDKNERYRFITTITTTTHTLLYLVSP